MLSHLLYFWQRIPRGYSSKEVLLYGVSIIVQIVELLLARVSNYAPAEFQFMSSALNEFHDGCLIVDQVRLG